MSSIKVGVIIVNYNSASDTSFAIDSVFKEAKVSPYKISVYLVNNGCTEPESFNLKFLFPKIKEINSKKNLGFGGGNNLGIKAALRTGCTHLLLLNNDAAIVSGGFFEKLINSKLDIAAPLLVYKQKGERLADYGGVVDQVFGRNIHITEPGQADYFSGACLLVSAQVLKKIKGFDEKYFLYYEDVDFCLRAKAADFSVGLVTKAECRHKLSASANKLGGRKIKILAKSHLLFCKTHLNLLVSPFYFSYNLFLRFKSVLEYFKWKRDELKKTFYPLANKIYCLVKGLPEVHLLGDSHVWPFYGVKPFVVHHLGASTAYNIGIENSKTGTLGKIKKIFETYSPSRKVFVFCFGEIDCRLHIYNQHKETGKSIERLIKETIDNYLKVVLGIKSKGFFVAVLSPTPAGTEKNIYNKKYFADFATRAKITKTFNSELAKECQRKDLVYLNLYEKVVNKKGGINPKYKKDVVHLNEKVAPILIKKIGKIYNKQNG